MSSKNKTGAGGDLGVDAEATVSERKSNKGKPAKPLRAWVSPAPETKKENVDVEQPNRKKKERERERTTNMIPKRGRVLKDKHSFKESRPLRQDKTHRYPTPNSKTEHKARQKQRRSQRIW